MCRAQLRCSFLRNSAPGAGGAITASARDETHSEVVHVRNCSFVGNTAGRRGGGKRLVCLDRD